MEPKVCPFCQRPSFLWGGDTCDVCDLDGDGINDKDEPLGIGPAKSRALFAPEEKGFAIVGSGHLQIAIGKWPVHQTPKQNQQYKQVMAIIERRYSVESWHQ